MNMVSYKGLEAKLNERGITRSDLTKELGIEKLIYSIFRTAPFLIIKSLLLT